jgi:hypothetical protein
METSSQIEKIEIRIRTWIRSIRYSLVTADVHFNNYWALQEFRGIAESSLALDRAPGFWMSTIDAHRDRGILLVWKILIDQSKESRSIPSLLKYVMNVPEVFTRKRFRSRIADSVIVDELVADYSVPDKFWLAKNQKIIDSIPFETESISKWRHLLIAHSDMRVIEGNYKLSEEVPISRESIRILTESAQTLINNISGLFDASMWTPGAAPRDIRLGLERLIQRESAGTQDSKN